MVLSTKPTVNGEDRPVDVTDQAVAENNVRDFPVPALPNIGQPIDTGNTRCFASGLIAQRLVRELRQFRLGPSYRRHR
jgi:hypothetical protein